MPPTPENEEKVPTPEDTPPAAPPSGPAGSLSFRTFWRILPYFWRWRYLFVLTVMFMGLFSVSVTMRNLLPALLFDGVLMPQSNTRVTEWVQPVLKFFDFESQIPDANELKGRFRELRVTGFELDEEQSRKLEREIADGKIDLPECRVTFILELGDDKSATFDDLRVTTLSVRYFEPEQAQRGDGSLTIQEGYIDTSRSDGLMDPRKLSFLKVLFALGIIISFVIAFSRFMQKYLEGYIIQNVLADMRRDLIDHMCGLSMGFFSSRSRGDLLSRISTDLFQVSSGLHVFFGDLVQKPMTFIVAVFFLFTMDWRLASIVVPLFIPLFFIILKFGRKVRKRSRKQSESRGLMTIALEQLFSGIRTVKSFSMEKFEKKHFEEKNRGVARQAVRTLIAKNFSNSSVEFASHFGIMLVLGIGGYLLMIDALDMSVGDLFAFIVLLNQMYLPVKGAARAYATLQESVGGMERVNEIFEAEPTVVESPGAGQLPPFEKSITFENVSFSYDREAVLRNIDLEIPKGSLTAIVGPTGAGKSTLVDLILRFYDPDSGRIRIDDTDIKTVTFDSLMAQISIVSQDPFLFDTTIANNIRYGRPEASRQEIEDAARAANVHEDIMSWPEGYETNVGDRGDLLSGGQRQRITIARSLLKNTPILILDEATSNLDSESESAVQGALEKLMKVRSTIAIAHRLSTIKKADNIIVLEDGHIAEQGSFDDLMEAKDLFFRLYSKQGFDFTT